MKTAAEWVEILTSVGVRAATAAKWADSFASEVLESNFSLGAKEIPHFLGNVLHECNHLERLEENLNYSTDALISQFGRHRISVLDAQRYGRNADHPANQPAIANCLYGGEWGKINLGNTESGDGWKYRGSGALQATGAKNIKYLQNITRLPLVENPDLLRRPGAEAIAVAIAWWEGKVPDSVIGNIRAERKVVNGGALGLPEVIALTESLQERLA